MPQLSFSDSVVVSRPPEALYDLVADVTRMGEWSPICTACWWDDDARGPQPGAWFTGRNETPDRVWETRCQVVAADRGREFAFVVGDGWVRWGYAFSATADGGTLLTESWEFTPAGVARFRERYGADAPTQIENRRAAAYAGIPATLAAVKRAADGG